MDMIPGLLFLTLLAGAAAAADLPRGEIIPDVRCADNAGQGYALYVPSGYTAERGWPVIFAFDPGGRGLNPVERYRAAAEKFGYIVAGSNNSRNGVAWDVTRAAVGAMTRDVAARFKILQNREYVAGMSGGSRVALAVALSSSGIAGVFASSAGYPDNKTRTELPFPVFETAGTEDFNNLEMRDMNRALKTPHRLAVFEGGHVWLSSELAMDAVEWMEIQAMKSDRKPRDQAEIDAIFTSRAAKIEMDRADMATAWAVNAMVEDFTGLEDVKRFSVRAAELKKDKHVRDEGKREAELEDKERQTNQVILGYEALLATPEQRADALKQLRQRWKALSESANGTVDTPDRRLARRELSGLSAGATTRDPDYLAIIREFRIGRQFGPNGNRPAAAIP